MEVGGNCCRDDCEDSAAYECTDDLKSPHQHSIRWSPWIVTVHQRLQYPRLARAAIWLLDDRANIRSW